MEDTNSLVKNGCSVRDIKIQKKEILDFTEKGLENKVEVHLYDSFFNIFTLFLNQKEFV